MLNGQQLKLSTKFLGVYINGTLNSYQSYEGFFAKCFLNSLNYNQPATEKEPNEEVTSSHTIGNSSQIHTVMQTQQDEKTETEMFSENHTANSLDRKDKLISLIREIVNAKRHKQVNTQNGKVDEVETAPDDTSDDMKPKMTDDNKRKDIKVPNNDYRVRVSGGVFEEAERLVEEGMNLEDKMRRILARLDCVYKGGPCDNTGQCCANLSCEIVKSDGVQLTSRCA